MRYRGRALTVPKSLSANVAAGFAVNNPDVKIGAFPTGDSAEDQIARIQASLVTLQNLDGEYHSLVLGFREEGRHQAPVFFCLCSAIAWTLRRLVKAMSKSLLQPEFSTETKA